MHDTSVDHIIVISGADPLPPHVVAALTAERAPDDAATEVVAVDGGLDHALAAGLRPTTVIGDLDSISPDAATWTQRNDVRVVRHPTDKDATDTELALADAAARSPRRITLVGGGDRLDHSLAAIGALGAPALAGIAQLDGWWDGHHLQVLHGPVERTIDVPPGSTLSILALHGPCRGVTVTGVRWPLDGAVLEPLVGLGVSNEAVADTVHLAVADGVLTVFDRITAEPDTHGATAPNPTITPDESDER